MDAPENSTLRQRAAARRARGGAKQVTATNVLNKALTTTDDEPTDDTDTEPQRVIPTRPSTKRTGPIGRGSTR